MTAQIKRKRASASSLFLTELMVAILFFALAATLCITVFVRAHLLSEDAKLLNHALNITSDAAEVVRTADTLQTVEQFFGRLYPNASVDVTPTGLDWEIYFDDAFAETLNTAAIFRERVSVDDNDGMMIATIAFYDAQDEEVYTVSVSHAVAAGEEAADE